MTSSTLNEKIDPKDSPPDHDGGKKNQSQELVKMTYLADEAQ